MRDTVKIACRAEDGGETPRAVEVPVIDRFGAWCVHRYMHPDDSLDDDDCCVTHADSGMKIPCTYDLGQATRLARKLGKEFGGWGSGCAFGSPPNTAEITALIKEFHRAERI